jgi:TatA/E family protein of Tat protein translocase
MLSIPHMIVVFLVVLVVFGPQKLPELARSFGKLMAEFRKASNDFKSAFEDEMRDLERQARLAEMKKQVAEANIAANAAVKKSEESANSAPSSPALPTNGEATGESSEAAAGSRSAEAPVISPVAQSVPRLDASNGETAAAHNPDPASTESAANDTAKEHSPSHDQQQPA